MKDVKICLFICLVSRPKSITSLCITQAALNGVFTKDAMDVVCWLGEERDVYYVYSDDSRVVPT